MYRQNAIPNTTLSANQSYEGETIEQKIHRIVNNKEPITDGAPIVYTDRKDGVQPQFDIRTDRFEIAVDAMSAVDKSHKAKREMNIGERTFDTMTPEQQKEHIKKFPHSKYNKPENPGTGVNPSDSSK